MATEAPAQRELFENCSATREAVEQYGTDVAGRRLGCPLCKRPPDEHLLESEVAGTVPDDAPLGEWMLNLPRSPI